LNPLMLPVRISEFRLGKPCIYGLFCSFDGLFEPTTSTSGSASKVVDGTARPYVPPGAGEWPYPYPWGDRRFDLRCGGVGTIVAKLRYMRAWETKYSWESQLTLTVLANP